jgi:hypothetical protein
MNQFSQPPTNTDTKFVVAASDRAGYSLPAYVDSEDYFILTASTMALAILLVSLGWPTAPTRRGYGDHPIWD